MCTYELQNSIIDDPSDDDMTDRPATGAGADAAGDNRGGGVGQRYPRIDIMDRLIPFCIYSTRSVLLAILSQYFISVTN